MKQTAVEYLSYMYTLQGAIYQDDINKGQVPLSRVTGRVFGVIWPFSSAKLVPSIPVLK